MGQLNEALEMFKRTWEVDPLSESGLNGIIHVLYRLKRYDEALEKAQRLIEINPKSARNPYSFIYLIHLDTGNYDEAIATCRKRNEIYGYSGPDWRIAYAYAISGERDKAEQILNKLTDSQLYEKFRIYIGLGETDKAEKILNEIIELSKKENILSFWIAGFYIRLGDNDKVFEWLDKSYEDREAFLTRIKVGGRYFPLSDPVRSDPRYKALLKKMGLSE